MTRPIGLRDALAAFAIGMEHNLRANDHKGGWDDFPIWEAFNRLKEETDELETAIQAALGRPASHDLRAKLCSEAADVANFAMMIADLASQEKDGWLISAPRPVASP